MPTDLTTDTPFAALTWRELGPWRGGRVQAVTGHPTDPARFFFGSTGGGVWRSDNAGATWRNISDGFFQRGTVGAIAVAEADPDTIYVGMGEGGLRNNVTGGDGVYRSRDGGATWERILFVDEGVGAADLCLDPQSPRFLYAATWRAGRTPWGFGAGGGGSGLWHSTDGGDSWQSLADAPGLPRGILGRIAVAVSPADSRRVYALIEAAGGAGGLYRSSDRGLTWTWISAEPNLLTRPWSLLCTFAGALLSLLVVARRRRRDGRAEPEALPE